MTVSRWLKNAFQQTASLPRRAGSRINHTCVIDSAWSASGQVPESWAEKARDGYFSASRQESVHAELASTWSALSRKRLQRTADMNALRQRHDGSSRDSRYLMRTAGHEVFAGAPETI
ncbi:MAG: hypothetical protein Q8J78_05515 [Moraxellaceae bacterium]|nr:hypothetical protein [Moraxellaceae bacterium]